MHTKRCLKVVWANTLASRLIHPHFSLMVHMPSPAASRPMHPRHPTATCSISHSCLLDHRAPTLIVALAAIVVISTSGKSCLRVHTQTCHHSSIPLFCDEAASFVAGVV
mmetsp:Transcript_5321/g.11002  ORF Transcript_5321/g.11002 Transcript_5321/m.11002 type:complete len:109 (-) Transcript_5321:12-338(-)